MASCLEPSIPGLEMASCGVVKKSPGLRASTELGSGVCNWDNVLRNVSVNLAQA